MADILTNKIYKTLDTYNQDIRPILSRIMNHEHGLEHLDETTLTGLLEQASSHIMLFQQNFEVNYNTLLKFAPSPLDNKLTVLSTLYEYYLNFVGLAFILALNWTQDFDKDDYPALRPLIYPLLDEDKFLYCNAQLKQFLATNIPLLQTKTEPEPKIETGNQGIDISNQAPATQDNAPTPPTETVNQGIDISNRAQATQDNAPTPPTATVNQGIDIPDQTLASQDNAPTPPTETVNQGIDIPDQTLATQDNAPPPPTDTPRHPIVHTDSKLDFELDFDSELDVDIDIAFEDGDEFVLDMPQDIELTETPSNPTETNDNIPPLDDYNSPSNTQDFNRPIDFDVDSDIDPDPDFDVDSDVDPDPDFDIDSDSDSDSDFEDIEGMFLAGCEIFRARIPPSRPVPLFLFG